jgi:integrase/recombinase XerC
MPTLLERFELDQKRRGLSPNTILLRHRQFKLFQRETGKQLDLATAEQIQVWLDGRNVSDKTRSCYLTTFSAFFKWATKHDYVAFDPISKIDRPKVHTGMPDPIPERELTMIIERCKNPMLKCWIVIEAYAGLRCQEVAFLSHEDIHLDVEHPYIRVMHGKGGKQRTVPVDPDGPIVKALAEYTAPTMTGRLWPFAKPSGVSQRINRYYHGAGLRWTAHKNRHRFGTRVYEASGSDILTTQRLLGHSSPTTTAIYANVSDEAARSAVIGL